MAIFRSKKVGDEWSTAKLIVSQFAAEPSLDNDGNLYFVHHFFKDGRMIEADIYVAYKKQPLQDLKVPNSIEAISCASMIYMNAKTESCHRRLKWRLQLRGRLAGLINHYNVLKFCGQRNACLCKYRTYTERRQQRLGSDRWSQSEQCSG